MSASPNFGSTPRCGTLLLNSASSTTATDLGNFTPVAAGTRVKTITVTSGPTTSPGSNKLLYILIHDGTSAFIRSIITVADSVSFTSAVITFRSLSLPSGYKMQFQMSAALASGSTLNIVVEGEDLT